MTAPIGARPAQALKEAITRQRASVEAAKAAARTTPAPPAPPATPESR